MEPQEIEILLDSLADYLTAHMGHDMPHVHRGVLYACLHTANAPYRKMPTLLLKGGYGSYSEKNLKNAGSTVFQTLSAVFREDIKKTNCHLKLLNWYRGWQRQVADSPSPANSSRNAVQSSTNLLRLQCRENDVAELVRRIRDGYRMICVSGAAGVGKTYLVHALIEQIEVDFDDVIRCEAADVQTIARLYNHVSKQNLSDIDSASAISALAERLRTRRMLLVIDHAEFLFKPQTLAGEFRHDCEGYEEWLRRLLASPFLTGCVVWVGREPPKCFDVPPAFCYPISRLKPDDAAVLLKAQGIDVEAIAGWENLVNFCGGNPTWLLRQASHLQRLSPEGRVKFLVNPSLDLNVTEAVQRVIKRLSAVEQILLYWLLLKPISYEQVRYLDIPEVLPQNLLDALASLERRSLIRHDANQHYRPDSPLLEQVLANHVVDWMVEELVSEAPHHESVGDTPGKVLFQYPLFHGSTSASRQTWQQQNLLRETVRRFQQHPRYSFRREQTQRLQELLAQVRDLPLSRQGYLVSNVLNLAIALGLPLTEFDLSRLHLRHVDLRRATLHGANLEGCTFEDTLLPLSLTGKLVADMDAEGGAIAIGDENGHLFYWQRDEEFLRLRAFHTLSTPIDKILFQESGTLILISHQTVYSWRVEGDKPPQTIIQLPDSAICLAYGSWGHIAIGLANGQIILWDELSQKERILDEHTNPVCDLAFSPNGRFLASIGSGNRVLVWNLEFHNGNGAAFPYQELSSGSRICGAIGWEQDVLVRAEVDASRIYLRVASTLAHERNLNDGDIIALNFSKNGRHLAGSSNSGLIFCWEWQAQSFTVIRQSAVYAEMMTSERLIPGQLTACAQGRWLLAIPGNHIQLYDLHNNEIFWEAQASSPSCPSCNLRSTQNLTSAEREVMRSLGAELSE